MIGKHSNLALLSHLVTFMVFAAVLFKAAKNAVRQRLRAPIQTKRRIPTVSPSGNRTDNQQRLIP